VIVTEIDIHIARSAAEVFEFLSNAENNPRWQKGMKSCTWITEPPIGVGSRYVQHAEFVGRSIDSTFEVIAYKTGRTITATTTESTFPIKFTRRVTPTGEGTSHVEARIEGDSSGVFRLMEPILAPLVRRSIRKDYARLKKLLEA